VSTIETVVTVVPARNEQKLIGRCLEALESQRTDIRHHIVAVDNGSTDGTAQIISDHPNVTLVKEPRKGTGYAANAGVRFGIGEFEPDLVFRTDADTEADPDWIDAGCSSFSKPSRMAITGSILPLHDEHYRHYDRVLLPLSYTGYRIGATLLRRQPWPLRYLRGGNMAIRPEAFEAVGGFPDGSIDDQDEDIELSRLIYEHEAYGFKALGNNRNMIVRTSMRRIRKIGYAGLFNYYENFTSRSSSEVRQRLSGGEIDIR
jgi:glycosyltransferase involved in cell wall biosynthesis